jgi:hypothetical protein
MDSNFKHGNTLDKERKNETKMEYILDRVKAIHRWEFLLSY